MVEQSGASGDGCGRGVRSACPPRDLGLRWRRQAPAAFVSEVLIHFARMASRESQVFFQVTERQTGGGEAAQRENL